MNVLSLIGRNKELFTKDIEAYSATLKGTHLKNRNENC
jgi:hypothetical protein